MPLIQDEDAAEIRELLKEMAKGCERDWLEL